MANGVIERRASSVYARVNAKRQIKATAEEYIYTRAHYRVGCKEDVKRERERERTSVERTPTLQQYQATLTRLRTMAQCRRRRVVKAVSTVNRTRRQTAKRSNGV